MIPRTEPIYDPFMRKAYGKLVKATFWGKLHQSWPTTAKVKVKESRGDAVFAIPTTSSMILGFVVLVPDHRGRDQFAIEIGWSTKGRFPELRARPSGRASSERVEFRQEEFICRLCNLWTTKDYWWGENEPGGSRNGFKDVFEELKFREQDGTKWQGRAIMYATDAVEQFNRFGIPYLDEYFATKQVERVVTV
jgi:hypothetical protein